MNKYELYSNFNELEDFEILEIISKKNEYTSEAIEVAYSIINERKKRDVNFEENAQARKRELSLEKRKSIIEDLENRMIEAEQYIIRSFIFGLAIVGVDFFSKR